MTGMAVKYILIGICLICLFGIVSGADYYTKEGKGITARFTCIDETTGNICSASANCNVSIRDRNGTRIGLVEGSQSEGFFDFIIDSSNLSREGIYELEAYCNDGGDTAIGSKSIEVNESGNNEGDNRHLVKVIVWLVVYGFVFFVFIYGSKVPLWNFVGWMFILINSIVGVTMVDGVITYIILGGSVIILVDRLYKFLGDFWEYEEG